MGGPEAGNGVQSTGTRVAAVRSWGAYCEFRRLTMRGDCRLIVLVARVRALAWSSSRNQRWRRLGRSGGKGPGVGLCAPQQFDVSFEGQLGVGDSVQRGPFAYFSDRGRPFQVDRSRHFSVIVVDHGMR